VTEIVLEIHGNTVEADIGFYSIAIDLQYNLKELLAYRHRVTPDNHA
jgi:hypothetical protein